MLYIGEKTINIFNDGSNFSSGYIDDVFSGHPVTILGISIDDYASAGNYSFSSIDCTDTPYRVLGATNLQPAVGYGGASIDRENIIIPCHTVRIYNTGSDFLGVFSISYVEGIVTADQLIASTSPSVQGGFTYEGATISLFLLLILVLFFFKVMSDRLLGVKKQHTDNY